MVGVTLTSPSGPFSDSHKYMYMHTDIMLDIDPMLFHVIKPSLYRQPFNTTEVFNPIRQNYVQEEEKK